MPSLLVSLVLLTASATRVFASCAHGTSIQPRAEGGAAEAVKVNKFGYTGQIGPLNWASLDAGNGLCSTGRRQSPINMIERSFSLVPASNVGITIANMPNGTAFENLGTTVEVIAKGGTLTFSNKTFDLKQFHFHLPSEHLDKGKSVAMEMHMVWESAAKEIAVVGVFIDLETGEAAPATNNAAKPPAKSVRAQGAHARRQAGAFGGKLGSIPIASAQTAAATSTSAKSTSAAAPAAQPAASGSAKANAASSILESVFSKVGQIATPGTSTTTPPLDMSEIVNALKGGSFQAYSGSLTTPPCSEGVNWMVSTQKLLVKTATFENVRNVIGFNSRYPQNAPGQANLLSMAVARAVQAPIVA